MPTTITGTDGVSQVQAGSIQSDDLAAGVGGKVLQVVQNTGTAFVVTTSTSYVDASLSSSITPSSSTSKILAIASFGCQTNSNDARAITTIFRDSSNLGAGVTDGLSLQRTEGQQATTQTTIKKLDSPNTTSSVNYSVKIKSEQGGQVLIRGDVAIGTITLMEIAG